MITIIVFAAGSYLGFRMGARYQTITNLTDRARAKVRGWLRGSEG